MVYEGVNVLILDTVHNKVLCVKRAESDPIFGGMWALPGGTIEKSETHQQAAKRELNEEILANIKFDSETPVLQGQFVYHGLSLRIYIYTAKLLNGEEIRVNCNDISAVKWLSLETLINSLKSYNYPSVEIEKLSEYCKQQKTFVSQ